MGKGKSDKIRHKPCEQNQACPTPPGAEELIPENRPVRPANEVVDETNTEGILGKCQTGGGASRHHPATTTKAFVCGHMTKACSSRMPAKAARENIMFMRLSGGQKPDFRTPNGFRGKPLKGATEELFVAAAKTLKAEGRVKPENCFADGTKTESGGGRHAFVRKKTAGKNDKKPDGKLRAHVRMADRIWEDENEEYGERDLEEPGGKEPYVGKDAKGSAGMLRERLERPEAAGDEENKKNEKNEKSGGNGLFAEKKEA